MLFFAGWAAAAYAAVNEKSHRASPAAPPGHQAVVAHAMSAPPHRPAGTVVAMVLAGFIPAALLAARTRQPRSLAESLRDQ